MTRTKKHCEIAVKALLPQHIHCNKLTKPVYLSGQQINLFLGLKEEQKLNNDQSFCVCTNAHKMILAASSGNQKNNNVVVSPISQSSSNSPSIRKSPRLASNSKTPPEASAASIKRRHVPSPKQSSPPWKRLMVHRHHTRSQPNPFVKVNNLKGVSVRIGKKLSVLLYKNVPGTRRIGPMTSTQKAPSIG